MACFHQKCSLVYSKQTALAQLNQFCIVPIHVKKNIYAKMRRIITLSSWTAPRKANHLVAVYWADSVCSCFCVFKSKHTGSYYPSQNKWCNVYLPESHDDGTQLVFIHVLQGMCSGVKWIIYCWLIRQWALLSCVHNQSKKMLLSIMKTVRLHDKFGARSDICVNPSEMPFHGLTDILPPVTKLWPYFTCCV